jgi:ribosomal protein S2
MKINKITKYKHELIKLKLIKDKTYKTQNNNFDVNITIEKTINSLKKALNLIFKYHLFNKRILFVGTPIKMPKILKKTFKKTNHTFIPELLWKRGILTNRLTHVNKFLHNSQLTYKKLFHLLTKTKKRNDLIVIVNSCTSALNEGYSRRIPIVSIVTPDETTANEKSAYKILGNFDFGNKKIINNLFYFLLNTTVLRATKIRKTILKSTRTKQN